MDALLSALPLLILLACPLMMVLMMRGMHGGQDKSGPNNGQVPRTHNGDARIAELEREVTRLRAAKNGGRDELSAGRR